MPTAIGIASNSLLLVGDNPISSFTEAGAGATVASAIYSDTYEDLLSIHPWTFALKERVLSKLSATPEDETGYNNAFQLSSDMIRIWSIMPHSDYVIVGQLLYSNENSLLARFVCKPSESILPPYFVKTFQYKLAAEFAIAVTESKTKADFYEAKYDKQVARAKSIDSMNKPPKAIVDSPFIDARMGGY